MLLYLFIHSFLFIPVHLLSESVFTRRYSEWIMREEVESKCEWMCSCPSLIWENMCLCLKDGNNFHIESPYAALMIQLDFPDIVPKPAFSESDEILLNVSSIYDSVRTDPFSDVPISRVEPILSRFQLIPQVFPIRYAWNVVDEMKYLTLNNLMGDEPSYEKYKK